MVYVEDVYYVHFDVHHLVGIKKQYNIFAMYAVGSMTQPWATRMVGFHQALPLRIFPMIGSAPSAGLVKMISRR